jgi:hypothetical protein
MEEESKKAVSLGINYDKWKFGFAVASFFITLFMFWQLRQETQQQKHEFDKTVQELSVKLQTMTDNKNAYEAATQNVFNRLIGRLEGLGQKDFSNVLQRLSEDIKTEAENKQKEGDKF